MKLFRQVDFRQVYQKICPDNQADVKQKSARVRIVFSNENDGYQPEKHHTAIAPFSWVEGETSVSLCLYDVGSFKQDVFDRRADNGFEGNGGYDWASLARVFLAERLPQLEQQVRFDLK